MKPKCIIVGVACLALTAVACGDDPPTSAGDDIIFGAVFHDDASDSAKKRLQAIRLAIEEINDSGVFERTVKLVNRSPSIGDSADADKAADNAKALHDQDDAVGVLSLFSSLGKAIIGVTNSAGYEDLVQCNCSATNPTLNDSSVAGSDANDTFYRTVVTDTFQGELMVQLVIDNGWEDIGIYSIDDSFGTGLRDVVVASAAAAGTPVNINFNQLHPASDFDVATNQSTLDAIITNASAGQIDALLLPTLKAQAPSIVKYLTENNYVGGLVLSDGAKAEDMFTVATGLSAWLAADAKNILVGTEPDTYGGTLSDAFQTDYVAKWGEDPDTYSTTAYDCTYAMALSLLYAGDANLTAAGVKANIVEFKEANQSGSGTAVSRGEAGLQAAATAAADGGEINFNGASGMLLFDASGDRPSQGMRTYGPNSTVNDWEIKDNYDADLNKI